MTDPIFGAIEEVKRRIEEQITFLKETPAWTDVVRLREALNALEGVAQLPKTSLSGLFGLSENAAESLSSLVKFDEFYGIRALDAAKRYLRKRSDARPFDEIVAAIKVGGGKVESENELRMSLSRSTLDIVKIGERYGALENYGHIKRGGKKKPNAIEEEEEEQKNEAANED